MKRNKGYNFGGFKKTLQAEQDLLDLWLFIARDDETSADKFYSHIEERCSLYADNPSMGAERPELYQGLRCFPVRSHIIYYLPIYNGIELIRILHSRQDITEQSFGE